MLYQLYTFNTTMTFLYIPNMLASWSTCQKGLFNRLLSRTVGVSSFIIRIKILLVIVIFNSENRDKQDRYIWLCTKIKYSGVTLTWKNNYCDIYRFNS